MRRHSRLHFIITLLLLNGLLLLAHYIWPTVTWLEPTWAWLGWTGSAYWLWWFTVGARQHRTSKP